jgi:hypothetical protein
MVMSSRVHSVSRMCPAEPLLRCWPAGPAIFVLSLALWAASSGISEYRLEAGEAKAEDRKAADAPGEKPVGFTSISCSISHPLGWSMPEQIEIQADGSCVYTIQGRPARGQEKEWPPARQDFHLEAGRLHQLEALLQKTDWLAAPGGGPERGPRIDDAEKVTLVLVRDGQIRRLTSEGQRPEPYASLLWFFQGLILQENRLYRLVHDLERPAVCDDLSSEIRGLQGVFGMGYPLYDIDYTRYLQIFTGVLKKPYEERNHERNEEIVTAVELVSHLGLKSEMPALVRLAHDRDNHVRAAVAKALAVLGGPEVVAVLAEMVDSTEEARWSMVRMGDRAIATIAGVIAKGDSGDQRDAEKLVRAYIDHWPELPGPIDDRIVEAARSGSAKNARGEDRTETQYYEQFLELVASDPIPVGDLTCRLDRWTAFCPKPARLIHGWYVVADGRIVEHDGAPAPEAGTGVFRIVFDASAWEGSITLETGWNSLRWTVLGPPARIADRRRFDAPAGSKFEVAYDAYQQRPFANGISPVRLREQFRTLWEGRFVKDGQVIRRIVYAARVVGPEDPARQFEPPAVPAPTKGEYIRPRGILTFRGLDLGEETKVSDPAVLHDLALAGKNATIRKQGGTVKTVTKTDLIFDTAPADKPGERFAVFEDRAAKVFYIQVETRGSGPGQGTKVEYFGPFPGNPVEKLRLPTGR